MKVLLFVLKSFFGGRPGPPPKAQKRLDKPLGAGPGHAGGVAAREKGGTGELALRVADLTSINWQRVNA